MIFLGVNVAKDIGNNQIKVDDDVHPSILAIRENHSELTDNPFSFSPVDENFVSKRIEKINIKKTTDIDGISPKLLHFAKPVIIKHLTKLLDSSLS